MKYVCCACGYETSSNSNIHQHTRTVKCQGAQFQRVHDHTSLTATTGPPFAIKYVDPLMDVQDTDDAIIDALFERGDVGALLTATPISLAAAMAARIVPRVRSATMNKYKCVAFVAKFDEHVLEWHHMSLDKYSRALMKYYMDLFVAMCHSSIPARNPDLVPMARDALNNISPTIVAFQMFADDHERFQKMVPYALRKIVTDSHKHLKEILEKLLPSGQ